MLANGLVQSDVNPKQMKEGLVKVASMIIKDPESRGWEIIESYPKYIMYVELKLLTALYNLGCSMS